MKLPLHIKLPYGVETPQSAAMKFAHWHGMMSLRKDGFRQPKGTGSKRVRPRHGHAGRLHESPLFLYLNGLAFVAQHGGYDARL